MSYIREFLVYIGLDKVKTIGGGILADALQQLCGYAQSLHLRRDHKAKYGFYLDIRMVFLYWPIRAQIIDTELTIRVGVAPSHDFIAAVGKITL